MAVGPSGSARAPTARAFTLMGAVDDCRRQQREREKAAAKAAKKQAKHYAVNDKTRRRRRRHPPVAREASDDSLRLRRRLSRPRAQFCPIYRTHDFIFVLFLCYCGTTTTHSTTRTALLCYHLRVC